ncbi:GNAT family N-acetyltransferase [Streptoalloteichus hindustanus]|uniref:Ribosomal protein S18 acetylase RimI n=1 Tax=Streptoalloteichus hindustanus TaxID=2017 RepID=A0A1M5GIC2_STRHI|nr:GNAT family N-acetyltransferase [Streptoalloteichus hindustanus]SHG03458.1 Ribosomal protein S18 acetylase RimI [Streptoalloteichus hindustanus]
MATGDAQPVPMRLDHLAGVLELGHRVFDVSAMPYTSWSLSSVAVHLDAQPDACWVVEDGGRVVAFVLGSLSYDEREDWGYVEWIGVDPAHQGRGLARTLLQACCAALFAAGATRIVTDVEQGNEASARLMQNNGFTDSVTVTLFVRHAPDTRAPRAHRGSGPARDPAKARLQAAARKTTGSRTG